MSYDGPERRGHISQSPNTWLHEQFAALSLETKERHERLRSDMNAQFEKLGARFSRYVDDSHAVADRVLVIETERREEAKQSLKRGTWAGILAAAGVSALLRAIEAWLHRP